MAQVAAGEGVGRTQVIFKKGCLCSIEGCGKKVQARGWCANHYYYNRNFGDPLFRKRRKIEFNGEAHTIGEWADIVGISFASMSERLRNWPLRMALTKPRRKRSI